MLEGVDRSTFHDHQGAQLAACTGGTSCALPARSDHNVRCAQALLDSSSAHPAGSVRLCRLGSPGPRRLFSAVVMLPGLRCCLPHGGFWLRHLA